MKFVDEVSVYICSGKGGDGAVSLLRERFRPKGGPDGGDGGKGGDVVFVADRNLHTLLDFRYRQHYRAENGQPGMGRERFGRYGEDCVIRVPIGTVVADDATGEVLADLTSDGHRVVLARGGRGGRGNVHFKSATNQTPRYAEKGGPAVELRCRLTLKLMADVGLVGFPNAGKSTLVSRLSAAKPKIAAYPFTTLAPKLGLVRTGPDRSFVLADIPGLIEGASDGAGLGHRFLKHVERVSVNVYLLCVSFEEGRDPVRDYEILRAELSAYSPSVAAKPGLIVLNKRDLEESKAFEDPVRGLAEADGFSFMSISALTGDGLDALKYALQEIVDAHRAAVPRGTEELEDDGLEAGEFESEDDDLSGDEAGSDDED